MWNYRIMWHFLQASFFAMACSSWQIELAFWQLILPPWHSPIVRIAMRDVGQNYRTIEDESAKAIFPFVVQKMSQLRPFWRKYGYCKSFLNNNSGETTPWRSGWSSTPFACEKHLWNRWTLRKRKVQIKIFAVGNFRFVIVCCWCLLQKFWRWKAKLVEGNM